MKVKISENFDFRLISFIERKLVRRRIKELKECSFLGEVKYGRPHPLRGAKSSMYGLRIGKTSRLILLPFEYDKEQGAQGNKPWSYYITGVVVYYSPNHYRTYY